MVRFLLAALTLFLVAAAPIGSTAAPVEGDYTARDFIFASGEKLPALRLHYTTLGTPRRDAAGHVINAVMILHGTGGTGQQFFAPQFANVLFGPGQPLDTSVYYVILPDEIGHGASSKPSDGLHARFPHYAYADMVAADHLLLTKGLGVDRLRLLMGTSMGCMHTLSYAEAYPGFARALMPLACVPVPISGANRQWRKLAIDGIKLDPAWAGGDYKVEPAAGLRTAMSLLVAFGSAPVLMQHDLPTGDAVDAAVTARMARDMPLRDANDLIYQLDSSRDYDPGPKLATIEVPLTWVNSGDDLINPPELHLVEPAIGRVPKGRFVLIPASLATRGHGTHTSAALWKDELVALLARSNG